ncbi:hypothetical protein [Nonomuraea africana]|uniref:Uncharacterized protein n=1 Tax=Nonomuraea africana TaxID=46171 RepID=A0ABR9KAZ9_9ACTN|nr:hypothetical protein [Nonomuraea africana]MBE1559189.1 hypothetical protein [Nonomuraea africana]
MRRSASPTARGPAGEFCVASQAEEYARLGGAGDCAFEQPGRVT